MATRDEETLKGSSARLWSLIEQRTHADADTARIDARVWELFGEEWAIVFTDLAGFSRQVAKFGIVHFLQIIWEQKKLLLPIVERYDGILIKVEADSFLLLFKTPATALACAIAMSKACRATNARRAPEEQIVLCVGLGYGRLLKIGDEDVFGHEVNLASKLGEDIAKADEILVTQEARKRIGDVTGVAWEEVQVDYVGEISCWRVVYS